MDSLCFSFCLLKLCDTYLWWLEFVLEKQTFYHWNKWVVLLILTCYYRLYLLKLCAKQSNRQVLHQSILFQCNLEPLMLVMLSQAWEGGPLFDFCGGFVGMNLFTCMGKSFHPWCLSPLFRGFTHTAICIRRCISPFLLRWPSYRQWPKVTGGPFQSVVYSDPPLLYYIHFLYFSGQLIYGFAIQHPNWPQQHWYLAHFGGGLLFQCQVPRGTTLCFMLSFLL
jgi:hypothetical protein